MQNNRSLAFVKAPTFVTAKSEGQAETTNIGVCNPFYEYARPYLGRKTTASRE